MMKVFRAGCAIASVVALTWSTHVASAQSGFGQPITPRTVRVGFGGGVSVPRSDYRDALKNGVNGEGFLLVDPPGAFPPMRFNLSYQKFDFKDALTAGTNGDSQIFGSTGGFSVDLIRGPVRPYITAGVGAFNVQTSFDGAASSRDVSSTKFGIDGGAGLAVQIGRIDAFLEARLQNVYTERGLIDQKTIQVIPITVGIVF